MPDDAADHGSRAQQVAAALEGTVLDDQLPPGHKLGLRTELITQFAVSPSVMNEALKILRERHLVSVKPGVNGGVFVANPPPHVRLGGIDLWFQGLTAAPEQLFDARSHLDTLFPPVALERATSDDINAMEGGLRDMEAAQSDPRAWLETNMRLHLTIARASHIEVLIGMYQALTTMLTAGMVRASYIGGHEQLLRQNMDIHSDLVGAIRDQDRPALEKIVALHHQEMIRIDNPAT